jgi:hypothetical protein
MDFFHHLDRQPVTLDLVLVDGNHDFEFALFDLQMSARLLRPGGIVIMDNAEQTGPFKASQHFLANNREWRELGSAVASHRLSTPFDNVRASVPDTSFIILQAPDHIPVSEDLRSWGQVRTKSAHFDGIRLELPAQRTAGWLHYQALLRAFLDDGSVPEHKAIGKVRIDVDGATTIFHPCAILREHNIRMRSTSRGRQTPAARRLRCRRCQRLNDAHPHVRSRKTGRQPLGR